MSKMIERPASGWKVKRVTTHPGVILNEDFLKPLGMTAHQLSLALRVPATRIGEILHERRSVTTDTALRLAKFFGTSPEFWINLQMNHDLSKARQELQPVIDREVQPLAVSS